jgi:serine/threonine protein kinase
MSSLCFFINSDTKDRSDCEKLSKIYSKKEFLGKGAYGSVHQVCKNIDRKDCGYVLKTIIFDKETYELSGMETLNENSIKKQWLNEVSMLNKLNNCQKQYNTQFVPIIYDAWYCQEDYKTYFYIIMEKFDGNLNVFINKYKGKYNKLLGIAIISKLELLTLQLKLIHRDCNICLNDIKLDNILYKQIDDYTYSFVFADTGKSSEEITDECKIYDTDKFILSINELKEKFADL